MEADTGKQTSRAITGGIICVAEEKQTVVVIPVVLEVTKVELVVTIRIAVHVRHPVVTVSGSFGMCVASSIPPGKALAVSCILCGVFVYSRMRHTDGYDFFRKEWCTHRRLTRCAPDFVSSREFDDMEP